MKLPKPHPVLQIWRKMPPLKIKEGVPVMKCMRGDPFSDVCIIAPAPQPEDYEQGTPLSNPSALFFHGLLKEETGLSTQRCCVLPCSRYGFKANKASTIDICEALQKMVKLNQFKLYITVGDDAYKFFFGRGKKPAPSIFGNIMYVAEVGHKPVFSFPELTGLHISSLPGDRRAANKAIDWQNKVETQFRELMRVLKPLAQKFV